MKFPRKYTLKEIANLISAKAIGDENFLIEGFNEIHRVEKGDIVFVDHPKYYSKALGSAASVIIINQKVECPNGKALLFCDDPFAAFNKITKHFCGFEPLCEEVSETAKIGRCTIIQKGASIGNNVVIGENCFIQQGAIITDGTIIGNNVIIGCGTVLGGNAFYYKKRPEGFDRLLSSGKVVICDDVEIGCNCTIDRGVSSETIIGKGTKIDNLVHIGHDTIIGEKCLFASQVGIAGCTNIGNEVVFWGQVGVTSGITVGDKAVVMAQSGVSKSLEGGKIYFGYPAQEFRKQHKQDALVRMLPEILKEKGII